MIYVREGNSALKIGRSQWADSCAMMSKLCVKVFFSSPLNFFSQKYIFFAIENCFNSPATYSKEEEESFTTGMQLFDKAIFCSDAPFSESEKTLCNYLNRLDEQAEQTFSQASFRGSLVSTLLWKSGLVMTISKRVIFSQFRTCIVHLLLSLET